MTRSMPATTACSILWALLSAALFGCGGSGSVRTDGPVLAGGSTVGSGGVVQSGGVAGGGTSGTKSTGGTTATGGTTGSGGMGSGGMAGVGGAAAGGTATGGTTAGYGGSGTGGTTLGAGGATSVDAAAPDVPQVDAPAIDTKVAPLDGSRDGALAGIDAVRACKNTSSTQPNMGCRSVAECGPTGPVKCCTESPCWPASACPLSPLMCPSASSRLLCTTNQDCNPGGTCVSTVSGCPQCEYRSCQYPPPPCTQSPDSCGSYGRCQPDGGCAPTLCTNGYDCNVESRCNVGGPRADGHGCELIPCDDGWACAENARCTAPTDPGSHGCVAKTCTYDGECDCGYCVNGTCADNLGTCSPAPQ